LPQLINIYVASDVDRPTSVAYQDSVINRTEVENVKKPQVGCYDEIRRVATKQFDDCVQKYRHRGAMHFLNLSWFSAFDFIKNMKHVCDRKLTEVYVCKNYQNRAWSEKVIAKIKWCSFYRAAWNAVAV